MHLVLSIPALKLPETAHSCKILTTERGALHLRSNPNAIAPWRFKAVALFSPCTDPRIASPPARRGLWPAPSRRTLTGPWACSSVTALGFGGLGRVHRTNSAQATPKGDRRGPTARGWGARRPAVQAVRLAYDVGKFPGNSTLSLTWEPASDLLWIGPAYPRARQWSVCPGPGLT